VSDSRVTVTYLTFFFVLIAPSYNGPQAAGALVAQAVLPPPTGSLPVGRMSYDWTDASRAETLGETKGARREVMVHLWYPAEPNPAADRASYFADYTSFERCVGLASATKLLGQAGRAAAQSGALKVNAVDGARVSSHAKRYPLLIFSPGFDESCVTYSATLADLDHTAVSVLREPAFVVCGNTAHHRRAT
jgi:predicted dienelactone hydrolase